MPAEADLARVPPVSEAVERHPEKKDVLGFGPSPLVRTRLGDDTLEACVVSDTLASTPLSKFWERCVVKRELRKEPKLLAIEAAFPPTSAAPARTAWPS